MSEEEYKVIQKKLDDSIILLLWIAVIVIIQFVRLSIEYNPIGHFTLIIYALILWYGYDKVTQLCEEKKKYDENS